MLERWARKTAAIRRTAVRGAGDSRGIIWGGELKATLKPPGQSQHSIVPRDLMEALTGTRG